MENEIILNVRKRSTFKFILFFIITLGYYFYVWLWKLVKDINNLDFEQNNRFNFWSIAFIPFLLQVCDLCRTIITWHETTNSYSSWDNIYCRVLFLVYFIISLKLIKKIEEYSLKKYNVKIKHNPIWAFLFPLFYVNYALNTFQERVAKAAIEDVENVCNPNCKIGK